MENKKAIGAIALMVTIVIVFGYVSAANNFFVNREVQQTGLVTSVDIQVYSDVQCTQNLLSLDWGTVDSPSTNNRIVYVKNTGTVPVTLDLSDYPPEGYSVTWDQQDVVLDAGISIATTLTLSVPSQPQAGNSFDFTIIITGIA